MKNISRKNFLNTIGIVGTGAIAAPSVIANNEVPMDFLNEKPFTPFGRKIKVGVIGCGSVARKYLPHLAACPYAEIVSLCDIKPERAKERAELFKVQNWYPDIESMLAGVPFDLIVNLTNMQEHGRLNKIAINAGKHVWSEKPMANTYAEGAALVKLAQSKGTKIWGAPMVANSPQFAYMSQQIQAGKLGKIAGGHGSYGHQGPSWSSFFYEKFGGSLPDLGVYNIATMVGLLGPAKAVTAMTSIVTPTREMEDKGHIVVDVEDNAHLLLDHGNGIISHIQCGFNYVSKHGYEGDELTTLFVDGHDAKLDMIGYDWAPFRVDVTDVQNGTAVTNPFATDRGSYKWEEGASIICEHLSTGKELVINVAHVLHVLEIIEATRLSQETGKRIPLKSTFKWPMV